MGGEEAEARSNAGLNSDGAGERPHRRRSQSVASTQPSVETVVVKAKRAASTLWALLHAKNCVLADACTHATCKGAKLLHLHLKTCPAGDGFSCPASYRGCEEARKLLGHYRRCRTSRARQAAAGQHARRDAPQQAVCLVCSLVARQARSVLDAPPVAASSVPPTSSAAATRSSTSIFSAKKPSRRIISSFMLDGDNVVMPPPAAVAGPKMPPPPPRRASLSPPPRSPTQEQRKQPPCAPRAHGAGISSEVGLGEALMGPQLPYHRHTGTCPSKFGSHHQAVVPSSRGHSFFHEDGDLNAAAAARQHYRPRSASMGDGVPRRRCLGSSSVAPGDPFCEPIDEEPSAVGKEDCAEASPRPLDFDDTPIKY